MLVYMLIFQWYCIWWSSFRKD